MSVSLGNDVFRKLCCECFRYVRINRAPADVTATVFISPNPGMGFYAVAGVEIIHCGARARLSYGQARQSRQCAGSLDSVKILIIAIVVIRTFAG